MIARLGSFQIGGKSTNQWDQDFPPACHAGGEATLHVPIRRGYAWGRALPVTGHNRSDTLRLSWEEHYATIGARDAAIWATIDALPATPQTLHVYTEDVLPNVAGTLSRTITNVRAVNLSHTPSPKAVTFVVSLVW